MISAPLWCRDEHTSAPEKESLKGKQTLTESFFVGLFVVEIDHCLRTPTDGSYKSQRSHRGEAGRPTHSSAGHHTQLRRHTL